MFKYLQRVWLGPLLRILLQRIVNYFVVQYSSDVNSTFYSVRVSTSLSIVAVDSDDSSYKRRDNRLYGAC